MARPRKTVKVALILERANNFLRETQESQQRERFAVASFCEAMLHDADAYAGFCYLASAGLQREKGHLVDIADESRRCYYTHASLWR